MIENSERPFSTYKPFPENIEKVIQTIAWESLDKLPLGENDGFYSKKIQSYIEHALKK